MLTWTDRRDGEWRLTEGEEEGIKADLTAWWNLRDEPLGDTADGHWRTSHMTDCSQVIIDFRGCDRINSDGLPVVNTVKCLVFAN